MAESESNGLGVRFAICKNCSKEFEYVQVRKPKKFCSAKCNATWHNEEARPLGKPKLIRLPKITKACEQCGSQMKVHQRKGTKYCSLECTRIAATLPHRVCPSCNKAFKPKINGTRRGPMRQRYCSQTCARLSHNLTQRKIDMVHRRMLAAEVKSIRNFVRDTGYVPPFCAVKFIRCSGCGEGVRVNNYMQKMCAECAKARARVSRKQVRKKQRSMGIGIRNHVDRARKYGVPFDRRLSAIQVFERDGWACRVCGCATPKSLRGTYAPNAPELDHVVPLSRGGAHVMSNVQCACRSCNGSKGASLLQVSA